MGPLPGKEGPLHPPSLAAGVLRLLVLLVGVQGMWRDEVLSSRGGPQGPQAPPLSWPRALRKVRSWLAPYVMLWRYWRAFSGMPPPAELRRLLEQLFAGRGLYLYVH